MEVVGDEPLLLNVGPAWYVELRPNVQHDLDMLDGPRAKEPDEPRQGSQRMARSIPTND
jgi:hypothetical protein